jgi:hypothetical protein
MMSALGHLQTFGQSKGCALHPRKRTSELRSVMSAKGQKLTPHRLRQLRILPMLLRSKPLSRGGRRDP